MSSIGKKIAKGSAGLVVGVILMPVAFFLVINKFIKHNDESVSNLGKVPYVYILATIPAVFLTIASPFYAAWAGGKANNFSNFMEKYKRFFKKKKDPTILDWSSAYSYMWAFMTLLVLGMCATIAVGEILYSDPLTLLEAGYGHVGIGVGQQWWMALLNFFFLSVSGAIMGLCAHGFKHAHEVGEKLFDDSPQKPKTPLSGQPPPPGSPVTPKAFPTDFRTGDTMPLPPTVRVSAASPDDDDVYSTPMGKPPGAATPVTPHPFGDDTIGAVERDKPPPTPSSNFFNTLIGYRDMLSPMRNDPKYGAGSDEDAADITRVSRSFHDAIEEAANPQRKV